MRRQLESIYDAKSYSIFRKNNPAIEDLEYIEKILIEGKTIFQSKSMAIIDKNLTTTTDKAGISLSPANIGVFLQNKDKQSHETSENYSQTRGLNVQEFLNKINDILKKAKIGSAYIFLDEYSDLNPEYQLKFSKLLKNFLGSKTNIFVKDGVITDRFDFGDKIIIGYFSYTFRY